jgi:hypothetical protein
MKSLENGLQSVAAQVSDGPLGRCGEGIIAIEFSAAVTPAAWQDVVTGAWDRTIAGLMLN